MKRLLFALAISISMFAQTPTTPKPEWVPEPSAGHYDCPDGWTAYSRSEPIPYSDAPITANAVYIAPPRDKKGHALGQRPPEPICIQDHK